MTARAYYNEFDPFAAQWLREMIGLGVIPPGEVDDRSIKDVTPNDLKGFTQCHFFAGIGGWGYAARLAGWPDDRPLWSGSCPCQPFSTAGDGLGFDDPRDLWPDFRRLIRAARPAVVVGEQVAKKAGVSWFDRTHAHLARDGYASRAVAIPACAVDSPQERLRLWWAAVSMACADSGGPAAGRSDHAEVPGLSVGQGWADQRAAIPGRVHGAPLGDMAGAGRERPHGRPGQSAGYDRNRTAAGRSQGANRPARGDVVGGNLGGAAGAGSQGLEIAGGLGEHPVWRANAERADGRDGGRRNGTFWSDATWIACHDGKARRAEPGSPLLAHGVSARIPKWRGFGNAIVPQLAAEVLGALIDVLPPWHGAGDGVGRAA